MKAKILTVAIILILQATFLFGGNETSPAPVAIELSPILLAPVTPAVATFEEIIPVKEIVVAGPLTPEVATFEETASETPQVADFAPVSPAGADFEDTVATLSVDFDGLAPVIPASADFE